MLYITRNGHVDAERVKVKIFERIERGRMDKVNGIVVHQTGGSTAGSTFSSYAKKGERRPDGAHFLIDKDGSIYQTASLYKSTNHVGVLRSRCLEIRRCSDTEIKTAREVFGKNQYKKLSRFESQKGFPSRYPSNTDSIGIEIVGMPISGEGENAIYETVTEAQNSSLKWLIKELVETLGVAMNEIYRHPQVSYKVKSEAGTAKW